MEKDEGFCFFFSAACFHCDHLESVVSTGDLYAWFQHAVTALAASSLDTVMNRHELLFLTIILHLLKNEKSFV